MPFAPDVKMRMFVRCNRLCCLCHKQCGLNIEAAHIIDEAAGGSNDEDNGIPLCFDCHQEIGSYNDKHPRGNKFRPDELRARRDRVYAQVVDGRVHMLQPTNFIDQKLSLGWANVLPDELKHLISLELTTPPPISRSIGQSPDGQFWLVYWDSPRCLYRWEKITEGYAAEALQPVARYRNLSGWRELLKDYLPNPLHRIIDLLTKYHSALGRLHHAKTNEARLTSFDEWSSCHAAVWENSSVRDDTIRKLADPAKEWLSRIRSPYVHAEDFNLVEEGACVLSGFAVSPPPMAMPDVYSKAYSAEDELWQRWNRQGDQYMALGGLIVRLKELAARGTDVGSFLSGEVTHVGMVEVLA